MKKWYDMTIGVSIVHFVIKVPKLVQMIVTIYRVQAYQIPIVNPRRPPKIQDGRHEIELFWHFNIRPRWFPAHHRDRLVRYKAYRTFQIIYQIRPQYGTNRGLFRVRFLCITKKVFPFDKLHLLFNIILQVTTAPSPVTKRSELVLCCQYSSS